MKKMRMSPGGSLHLDEPSTHYLRRRKDLHVMRHVQGLDGVIHERPFASIEIDGVPLLANAYTGSLYRDNQCLSSSTLRLVEAPPKPRRRVPRKYSTAQVASGFVNGRPVAA